EHSGLRITRARLPSAEVQNNAPGNGHQSPASRAGVAQARGAVCSTLPSLSRISMTEPWSAAVRYIKIATPFSTVSACTRLPSGWRKRTVAAAGSETQPEIDCEPPPQASQTRWSELWLALELHPP